MKIGPKYKIARRLGAPIFEKTQTHKFTLSQTKKNNNKSKNRTHPSQITDYGRQMMEKQKARFSYLLSEKQFSNYVKKALSNQDKDRSDFLFSLLESRLDSVVLRAGLTNTRSAAKQMVSHGHIKVNGKRVNIPSYNIKVGDKINIREQSLSKGIFKNLDEYIKTFKVADWIKFDRKKNELGLVSMPSSRKMDNLLFNLESVLEFYSR